MLVVRSGFVGALVSIVLIVLPSASKTYFCSPITVPELFKVWVTVGWFKTQPEVGSSGLKEVSIGAYFVTVFATKVSVPWVTGWFQFELALSANVVLRVVSKP